MRISLHYNSKRDRMIIIYTVMACSLAAAALTYLLGALCATENPSEWIIWGSDPADGGQWLRMVCDQFVWWLRIDSGSKNNGSVNPLADCDASFLVRNSTICNECSFVFTKPFTNNGCFFLTMRFAKNYKTKDE